MEKSNNFVIIDKKSFIYLMAGVYSLEAILISTRISIYNLPRTRESLRY